MPSRTDATNSALLRACAFVTFASSRCVTLPFGSIKLKLRLPREVFRESVATLLRLQQQEVAHDEAIHLCAHEACERLRGRADDGLAAHVEGGVDQHRAARQTLEGRE